MKSRLKFIISTFLLLFLSNCVLFTKSYNEYYKFYMDNDNDDRTLNKPYCFVILHVSWNETIKTGFLKEKIIFGEPYYYSFDIYGNFERIENLEGYFIQNKTKKIPIPINIDNLNKNREISKWKVNSFNKYNFVYDSNKTIPITWNDTESLEVVVSFIGVESDGKKRKYNFKDKYKKSMETLEYTGIY